MKYLLLILMLAGCATLPGPSGGVVDSKPANEGSTPSPGATPEPTPAPEAKFEVASPKFVWADLLGQKLETYGKNLLASAPSDWNTYCKTPFEKLSQYQRKQFYIMMFSKLAQYESNYNPKSTYTENFKDSSGNLVISAGLFQTSTTDKGYGCRYTVFADNLDPERNIECAVLIADRWVGRDDKVLYMAGYNSKNVMKYYGMGRYWGPMRVSEKRAAIMGAASKLSFCQ